MWSLFVLVSIHCSQWKVNTSNNFLGENLFYIVQLHKLHNYLEPITLRCSVKLEHAKKNCLFIRNYDENWSTILALIESVIRKKGQFRQENCVRKMFTRFLCLDETNIINNNLNFITFLITVVINLHKLINSHHMHHIRKVKFFFHKKFKIEHH